jgi:hypothetical protein
MWTPTTRQQLSHPVKRYQTDLNDAEWRVIAPYLPKPCANGRPREWPMREIINGIFYVVRAGCPWRALELTGLNLEQIVREGEEPETCIAQLAKCCRNLAVRRHCRERLLELLLVRIVDLDALRIRQHLHHRGADIREWHAAAGDGQRR